MADQVSADRLDPRYAGGFDAPDARDSAGSAASGSAEERDQPSLSLPKAGGSVRGMGEKFSANPVTGTASVSIPVPLTAGRGALAPALSLGYDSGSGNGVFGLGWTLDAPSISRRTDKGLPRYRDSGPDADVYQFAGAEDLVPALEPAADGSGWTPVTRTQDGFEIAAYRPRTEGAYSRIERWQDVASGDLHWLVTSRDNITAVFGRDPASRIVDSADSGRVFRWLLQESTDDRGSVVQYEYKAEDVSGAAVYLKRIKYGNDAPGVADAFHFEAVLDYGEHDPQVPTPDEVSPWTVRADPFSTFRSGFEVRTYRLCRRVLMFHTFAELGSAPTLVRSLDLDYDETPVASYLRSATERGYIRSESGAGYTVASMPMLEFGYQQRVVSTESSPLTSGPGLPPVRMDDGAYRWIDLNGEGVAGILAEQGGTWFYRSNLGGGAFGAPAAPSVLPAAATARGAWDLMDLAGDGLPALASLGGSTPGYYARADDAGWAAFATFDAFPNLDWRDPNLRLVDLTGDGLADVLLTADDGFTWHSSLGLDGFGPERFTAAPSGERLGPRLVFADPEQCVYLADMTGDGLTDLVRVRNGAVEYWPNLGYGRFGGRTDMPGAPAFDHPDRFDQRRVRLYDIDGSGTTDLLYLGDEANGGVRVWFNESGNSWSAPETVGAAGALGQTGTASVADVLGKGTACLVFVEPRPDGESQAWYIDLMAQGKPHLLVSIDDHRGAYTEIGYASSTEYMLADAAAGQPWVTTLPFPVQVVAQVTASDLVADTTLVTVYRYRHGYFDGVEREFRGFGYVEQHDALTDGTSEADQPPAVLKRWQHTGWYHDRARITTQFAHEYWPGTEPSAQLPDTVLPSGLTPEEEREAARALRGLALRTEVYAADGSPEQANPYLITESSYGLVLIQPQAAAPYCVVAAQPGESVSIHTERQPDDPRVAHAVMLEIDAWGNVLRSAEIAYPRKSPLDPAQGLLRITTTERTVVNDVASPDRWRIGVPVDTRNYEAGGFSAPVGEIFAAGSLAGLLAAAAQVEIPYQDELSGAVPQRRMISRAVQTYCSDDLATELLDGEIGARALPWRSYRQAFAPGHAATLFGAKVSGDTLSAGGYVQRGSDGSWWVPSVRHLPDAAHFYQPTGFFDVFGERWQVDYDTYFLLATRVTDPFGNVVQCGINYRLVQPWLLTDANGNRSAVRTDALGMVVATAVMGKPGAGEGDVLDLSTPEASALDDPTTKLEYDLTVIPVTFRSYAREQHGAANTRWQQSCTYVDGSGRTILTKVQAEPAPGTTLPRWIGTGRVVYDNKGNPIKQYEPYFAADCGFDTEPELVQQGVTVLLRYDPLGRVIRTDYPDGTFAEVFFDAWDTQDWDRNDAVESSRWYTDRVNLPTADPRNRAALVTQPHADTPARSRFDSLGRPYLTVADNGGGELLVTTAELDIEGNRRSVTDPRTVEVLVQAFDMLGHPAHTNSPDAGERWTLLDATGKPFRAWDARATQLEWDYDALRRPAHLYSTDSNGIRTLRLRTYYGEALAGAAEHNLLGQACAVFDGAGLARTTDVDFKGNTLGGYRTLAADPHGEPDWIALGGISDPDQAVTASTSLLETTEYASATAYDALNRPTLITGPDGSRTRPTYNEATLLERLDVQIRGAADWTPLITNLDYNARGDRVLAALGCGATAEYTYDPDTFRLAALVTRAGDRRVLQSLLLTRDPVGNIVEIDDAAQQTLFFANAVVSPNRLYTYQPTYRLDTAEGREHIGQNTVDQPGPYEQPPFEIPHVNDAQAMRRYAETYVYDAAGNIFTLTHAAGAGSWTRRCDNPADSNRLRATSLPGDANGAYTDQYTYDANGNMASMPQLAQLGWDAENRLVQVDLGGGGTAYYQYDANGQRVRATIENGGTTDVRVYLGRNEIYRRTVAGTVTTERETLHVQDGARRVALIETTTVDGQSVANPLPVLRYQLDDHLGGSVVEVDADCALLSYEEYHPYGTTSFRSAAGAAQTSLKRYRFTGKERDVETGLYYDGSRYLAPWLGRWISPDPTGIADGPNTYTYTHGNPVLLVDPSGTFGINPDEEPTKYEFHGAEGREIQQAAGDLLQAQADHVADLAPQATSQLKEIVAADHQHLPQYMDIGIARIVERMIDKARERQAADLRAKKPVDFSIISLSRPKDPQGSPHREGHALDIGRYAGKDLNIAHPDDAPKAVEQFYADMLGVELPKEGGPPTRIEGEDPVQANFAMGLMRQPRVSGAGAFQDAQRLRGSYTYEGVDTTDPATFDVPSPAVIQPKLKDDAYHPSAFFPTSYEPDKSPTGYAKSDVNLLRTPSRGVMTDLVSKDTQKILHYLFPDGFNHFHIQTLR
jgi:RHS repeat-associated protein